MNNDRIEITDEMIACYLEGNLTEEDRSAVEAYLSENDEAMDDLMMVRTELAYQDDIASSPSVFAKSMIGYDDYAIAAASEKMDCAIKAQQMVLGNYGIETTTEELTELAKKNGWFEEGKGSAFDFVGELLNTYGVESVQMRNAGIYHIMHELSQGHKIIVGVDNDNPEQEDAAFGYDGAQHVMLVVGIDTTDKDNLKVVVKDPSHPDVEQRYPAKDFMERWKNTGCFMVATKQAAPLSANPEMENFDYQLGYVRKFADVAYEEIIKRLAEDGYIQSCPSTGSETSRKVKLYLIGCVALALLACAAYFIWRLATPYQMRVNITEDKAYRIPNLPFEKGTLTCEYADNALQTFPLTAENPSVFLNDIPYKYRNTPVHVMFEADGYQPIDTVVQVQKAFSLPIRRNNELGVVFGRVSDFKTGEPVANATVRLQDMEVKTDAFGQFRIEIPFAKQDKAQLLQVLADGYPVWEGYYRPSASEPWSIILGENQ